MGNQNQYLDLHLYNSRIVDNYIKLIKKKYNHINIKELLNYASMEPYEVADSSPFEAMFLVKSG